jgi:hypothetical protein
MKYISNKIITLAFALLFLVLQGCDLEEVNINEPDRRQVLATPSEVIALFESTNSIFFSRLISSRNVYYDHLADQSNSCSLSVPWPLNREPREQLSNDIGGTFERLFTRDWDESYRAITTANDILAVLDGDTWEDESEDAKNKIRAGVLTLKGIAMGYIGVIYRQGVIIEDSSVIIEDMVGSTPEDVINTAIEYLEEAKAIYAANSNLKWDYISDFNLSTTEITQIINTYAAKFLIGKARTHQEFQALDFNLIESYLDNAIEETFTGAGSSELYNGHQFYGSRLRRGSFSYSLDQKIPWLLSGKTAPTKKGMDDEPAITSIDKRAELYFEYTLQDKFRFSERDPTLFSNYAFIRYFPLPDDRADYPLNIIDIEEVNLLKAEVAYGKGEYDLARDIINSGRRVTVGEMPLITNDPEEIADALFYENSIELHFAGKGIQWMFMRRWDLLQEGTLLHLPIAAVEVQLIGPQIEAVTIGGTGTGDGIDSAKGDNSWR